jgi:pimeloyl-ACP methyl ester carboxylesterase
MIGLILLFLTAYLLIALIGSAVLVFRILRPPRKTYARAMAQNQPLDPADLNLPAEPATFHLPGQHTTPGWIISGKQPDGPTVLVLHGHGDARFGALLRAYHLAPYAGHVVVFDWPAHGECTAKWMTCGTREPGDTLAVLDQLPDALRNKPTVLFGYSLGGQIAIKTAGLDPARFAGVVADGPYRLWDSPVRERLHHHAVPAFPFLQLAGLVFYALGMIQHFDRVEYAKNIAAPLLILHGTDDRVCPIEEGRQLADAAPKGTFVAIEAGQHNHLYDHDPDTYHAALRNFFNAIQ